VVTTTLYSLESYQDTVMDAILEVENLNLSIGAPMYKSQILSNVSFHIGEGEVLGLVGESGSGKTMILRCILRLLEMYPSSKLSGKIIYHNATSPKMDVVEASGHDLNNYRRGQIGIVFQQSAQVLNPSVVIGDQIQERIDLNSNKSKPSKGKSVVLNLLDEVRISPAEEFYNRYPHELSGGQLQRVLIAMALSNNPRLLLADEPTFNLDKSTEKEIVDLLLSIKKAREISILFVSHDMSLVDLFCDRYITISDGTIIENSTQSSGSLADLPSMVTPVNREPIIQLKNINKAYKKSSAIWRKGESHSVLRDYSLSLSKGLITGLVGPSGCGKSTVAKIIAGIDYDYDGEYLLNGVNVKSYRKSDVKRMRQSIQIIFQDSFSAMPPHLTVIDLFNHVISAHSLSLSRNDIISLLKDVGLDESLLERLPYQLSGGQRQRLLIAKALIVKPDLLICDEIVSSLDEMNRASVIDILRQINVDQELTVLFVSHNETIVDQLCHEVFHVNCLES